MGAGSVDAGVVGVVVAGRVVGGREVGGRKVGGREVGGREVGGREAGGRVDGIDRARPTAVVGGAGASALDDVDDGFVEGDDPSAATLDVGAVDDGSSTAAEGAEPSPRAWTSASLAGRSARSSSPHPAADRSMMTMTMASTRRLNGWMARWVNGGGAPPTWR